MKFDWKSWSLLRILRLVVGVSLVGQSIDSKEWIFFPIGVYFLWQCFTNVGCSSCETDECKIVE